MLNRQLILRATVVASLFLFSVSQVIIAQEKTRSTRPSIGGRSGGTQEQKVSKPPQELKIFRLRSVDPEMAMQVVATLIDSKDCRIAVDPRTNGLIISGSKETVKVVEAILLRLDEGTDRKSTIVHLKNVPADEVAKILLKQLGSAEKMQLVADPRQNALLLSAPEGVMKNALELLEVLDVPVTKGKLAGKNVLINTYWIVDQASVGDRFANWKLREIPSSIEKLVKEKLAKRANIKIPMLATNLAVQAEIGEQLTSSSAIQNGGSGNINDQSSYEIDIMGSIWNEPSSGDKVDLELQMKIGLKGKNKNSGDSRIQTKISSPLNHPICLGMTPVNGVDSILVLEIVEAD